jgi:hypothetical protein
MEEFFEVEVQQTTLCLYNNLKDQQMHLGV